jgi:thiamine pyrophosphokinase
MSQVVVVIGGGPLSPRAITDVLPDATIVAADSGLDHAVAAGLKPTVLIGDLDSISAHGKMWAYAHELEIDQHPVDKGATDTELALVRAAATDAEHLLVFGAVGDRFDHALGTLAALGNPSLSLLALHGPCRGVDVTGARWELSDASFEPSSTRGVSNETTGLLHVAVANGILTLVVP